MRTKIAISENGHHPGISRLATFVRGDSGTAFALGIAVPTVRFDDKARDLRRALLAARPEFERIVSGR
jgi:DNA-binding IclR family transcriptional regulator